MRIIGGDLRSRRLLTPRDDTVTRPIPDRVKESLFGLLRGHCEDAAVFDAFAGTGALGLEALSRGAARCVFVERDREAADLLKRNIETLGVADRSEIVIGDALGPGALSRCPRPLNLAFFDPPYPVVRDALGWKRVGTQLGRIIDLLTPDGFAIFRTPHPFVITVHDGPTAAAASEQPRPKRRKKEGRVRRRHAEEWSEDPAQIAAWAKESEAAAADPDEPPASAPRTVPGDLTLPNALGPETHVYASTAVHLYMRKSVAAPAAPAAP